MSDTRLKRTAMWLEKKGGWFRAMSYGSKALWGERKVPRVHGLDLVCRRGVLLDK